MKIISATTKNIPIIASLADEIWREYYTPIIGKKQVSYMLETIQSAAAIEEQITTGKLCYYLLLENDKICGYLAYRNEGEGKFFLSKLYVLKSYRGRGAIKEALIQLKREGATLVYLTVNRENTLSIERYKQKGFVIIRKEDADIGGGYLMNDYIMEIKL